MSHTPGPWELNIWIAGTMPTGEITVSGPTGDEHICTMDGNEDNKANGSLIAAAPELLEALTNLHDACEHWENQNDPVLLNARKAITKATGKE